MTQPEKKPAPEAPLLEGGLDAPLLYFDDAPLAGLGVGVGRIALLVAIQDVDASGNPILRHRVVAHLRGSPAAFQNLRGAIDRMAALGATSTDLAKAN